MVLGRLLRGNSGSGSEASSPKAAFAAPPKEIDLDAAEQEWQLVDSSSHDQHDMEPLVIEDYLVVADKHAEVTSVGAEADLAAGEAIKGEPMLARLSAEEEELATTASHVSEDKVEEVPSITTEEVKESVDKADEEGVAAAPAPVPEVQEEPEPCFRCRQCGQSVFKPCDVISANYHAQTSPGYLTGACSNVRISCDVQTVVYTTGQYSVQDVQCSRCSAVLGITYTGADNARNQYKVGKYLVGIDRLVLPPGTVHPMDKSKNQA